MKVQILLLTIVGFALVSGARLSDNRRQCIGCHKVTTFIKKIANQMLVDPVLENGLIDICVDYSFGHRNETQQQCKKNMALIAQTVRARLDTEKVCEHTKACYATQYRLVDSFATRIQNNDTCNFCVFIFDKIKDMFTGEPTDIEMKRVLEDGCQYLGSFKQECTRMVDDYVDTLISYMKNAFQPKDMCRSMRYCSVARPQLHRVSLHKNRPFRTDVLPILETQPTDDNLNCVICKRLVKIIETQLKDNATDQQIVNVLNNVCLIMPKNEQPHCHKVVTEYARNLIQILTQDVDPDFACTLAGICNNQLLRANTAKHSNAICVQCQMITHFIQNELYNYNNEMQIEEFIKKHLCTKASFFLNEKSCDQFIEQYGPILIQTIAQEVFDPKTFCYKEVPVCKKPNIQQHLNPKACDMCVNMVEKLHLENTREVDIERFIKNTCNHMEPAHKIECGMMAKTFAPYIFDVLKHHDDAKEICRSLDICTVPGKVNLLGGHKCTFGPSYWCLSSVHAEACSASEYCNRKST